MNQGMFLHSRGVQYFILGESWAIRARMIGTLHRVLSIATILETLLISAQTLNPKPPTWDVPLVIAVLNRDYTRGCCNPY